MKELTRSGDLAGVGVNSAIERIVVEAPALDIDGLYAEHAPFIASVIRRLCRPGAHVDDLLQDTFIVAFAKQHRFDGRSKPRTWLYGIAVRLCFRHRRAAGRLFRFKQRFSAEPPTAEAPRPDRDLERAQQRQLVHDTLQKLSFKHREVFVLFELEQLEGNEIAELLGVPVGTVWTRLHHARKKFRDLFGATKLSLEVR